MLLRYIEYDVKKAKYKILENGTRFMEKLLNNVETNLSKCLKNGKKYEIFVVAEISHTFEQPGILSQIKKERNQEYFLSTPFQKSPD